MNRPTPSQKRVEAIVQAVAVETGIAPHEIRTCTIRRNPSAVSRARWTCWTALREQGFGYAPIARAWGCNHASVIHGTRRYAEERGA